MEKRVILTLLEGDFEQGFPAILQIRSGSVEPEIQISGRLPPAPQLLEQLKRWQTTYRQMVMPSCRIKARPGQIKNISCGQLGETVIALLNHWLNLAYADWQKIRDGLQRNLSDTDEILILIQTDNLQLRQLPWHLWNFFDYYPRAEVALSAPEYQPLKKLTGNFSNQIKVLAIFGNSEGINVEQDRSLLAELSMQAKIEFLIEPPLALIHDRLWEQNWDILFFAGHSSSKAKGVLQLNSVEQLSLDQLKYALKKAIAQGLKLAIFNSCDGLGLAQALADLQIPQVIVMREPVPDLVAQEFLRQFLKTFSSGQSLSAAVRSARERLQGLEAQYPCATWLPVLCQHPAEASLVWSAPRRKAATGIRTVLLVSAIVTSLILGVRHLGLLQPWELQAFDHLMQVRPLEMPDSRLLIVTIDEADIQYQNQLKMKLRWSLSDQALAQLLKKLDLYQPSAIGLDIYRDFAADSDALKPRLQNDDRLYTVCKVAAAADGAPNGTAPPPEVPDDRVSFSDFVADLDEATRRHLLYLEPPLTSACAANYAFSVKLATHYLQRQKIEAIATPEGYLQIGSAVFKPLTSHTSGYQGIDASGHQVLLNYRSLRSVEEIAPQVPLREILDDRINPTLAASVKNRIILIGVIAPTTADVWKTPYSSSAPAGQQQVPGVFVQAQMISQILSAVLDRRPLLWWWSFPIEAVWIWAWSLLGGILAWRVRRSWLLGVAGAIGLGGLFVMCFGALMQGGWIPLVPPALVLVITQIVVTSRGKS